MLTWPKITFVTAIDTGVGKTCCTGLLAAMLMRHGRRVITEKPVQSGCRGFSKDIAGHRNIMGCGTMPEDDAGLTCSYLFEPPVSPHLAARMCGNVINPNVIDTATRILTDRYEHVIIEGVGGLCVPLTGKYTVADFIVERDYPVVLVSTARVGSINQTLLTLEAMRRRNIRLIGIVYNRFFDDIPAVAADSKALFRDALTEMDYPSVVIDMPLISQNNTGIIAESWLTEWRKSAVIP